MSLQANKEDIRIAIGVLNEKRAEISKTLSMVEYYKAWAPEHIERHRNMDIALERVITDLQAVSR